MDTGFMGDDVTTCIYDPIEDLFDFPDDGDDDDNITFINDHDGGQTKQGGLMINMSSSSNPPTSHPSSPLPPLQPNFAAAVGSPIKNITDVVEAFKEDFKEEDDHMLFDEIDINGEIEWLSNNFFDDSGADSFFDDYGTDSFLLDDLPFDEKSTATIKDKEKFKDKEKSLMPFHTSSPVSVLQEPSSSGSSISMSTMSTAAPAVTNQSSTVPARARSKRPRPVAFSPRPFLLPHHPPCLDGDVDDDNVLYLLPPTPTADDDDEESKNRKRKHNKKKQPFSSSSSLTGEGEEREPSLSRACLHCGIQKTPQWRAGPMGPKTLCNACGVRYKSGRLFPEYRPAASPTFVPSIHSNSHKKVVEMRIKATQLCDLLQYIRHS